MMEDVVESTSAVSVIATAANPTMAPNNTNNEHPSPEVPAAYVKLLPRHYYQCGFPELVDLISMLPNTVELSPLSIGLRLLTA